MSGSELEHRFLLNAREARALLQRVAPRLDPQVHHPDRPVSFVRTTYFDTKDRMLLRSCEPAGSARVRLRQYAAATDRDAPAELLDLAALEVKETSGESRRKVCLVGTPDEIWDAIYGGQWQVDPFVTGSPELLRAVLAIADGTLLPVLTTYFRRVAGQRGGVRVTVDERIQFADPVSLGPPGQIAVPDRVFHRKRDLVVEVKLSAAGGTPSWLVDAVAPLRPERLSKFREGMLAAQSLEALVVAATAPRTRADTDPFLVFDHEPSFAYEKSFGTPTAVRSKRALAAGRLVADAPGQRAA